MDIERDIAQAARLLRDHRPGEAAGRFRALLDAVPDNPRLWANYGTALGQAGDAAGALAAYRRAVELAPENPLMRFNLGTALFDAGDLEAARGHLSACAVASPEFPWAHERLGELSHALNDRTASLSHFDRALGLLPRDMGLRYRRCLAELAICPESEAAIDASRAAYATRLRDLVAAFDPTDGDAVASAFDGLTRTPFYIAYQGRNDVELQRLYGRFVAAVVAARFPDIPRTVTMPPPPPDGRWRIGFVSRYFAGHSVWKLPLRGWLEHCDRRRFRLFGYATGPCPDAPAAGLCDAFVQGEASVGELARRIVADRLHAVVFPEVGMDWKTVCLAAMRLAPLQLAGAGHPETTGLETVDGFLSSALMEPPDGAAHYAEQLHPLPNLSSCNYPPQETIRRSRREMGLPGRGVLLLSPQSLFKYLPRYDDVFARIAEKARQAVFVCIRHETSPGVTACFKRRIEQPFRDRGLNPWKHVVLLPRLTPGGFTSLCAACDVFLDSLGWSGNNTSLEAIWQGLPVVTWPGAFMRGRHAAANLRMTGVTETVCGSLEEYVALAAALANDADKRREAGRALKENRLGAFYDTQCVRGLEELLVKEIGRRQG
jgi:predicted O-linked N-acetylglucosamine transferase (SPINDLY family)